MELKTSVVWKVQWFYLLVCHKNHKNLIQLCEKVFEYETRMAFDINISGETVHNTGRALGVRVRVETLNGGRDHKRSIMSSETIFYSQKSRCLLLQCGTDTAAEQFAWTLFELVWNWHEMEMQKVPHTLVSEAEGCDESHCLTTRDRDGLFIP